MRKRGAMNRPLLGFVVVSYAIFFMFFILIGTGMVLGAPEGLTGFLQIISAWSSTFAFIILFKKIYPESRLIDFVKEQFAHRIRIPVILTIVFMQIVIVIVAMCFLTFSGDTPNFALSLTVPGVLVLAFLNDLVRGPLGEELGWRGYALNELQKSHSPLKAALIIGVLWGFWHTPLWLASGYTGLDLMKYMLLFMIGIISFSVVVTFFYNLNKNLVVPIIAHQIFNFSLVLISGDLLNILSYVMLLYFVFALILVVLNPKGILYKRLG